MWYASLVTLISLLKSESNNFKSLVKLSSNLNNVLELHLEKLSIYDKDLSHRPQK